MDTEIKAAVHFPRWEELPDIDLYMDQLISYIQKHLSGLLAYDTELTPGMVNNYVKQKLLPPPIKKRYSREHIAALFVICDLKQVLSINEIKMILEDNALCTLEVNYNSFCNEQETALQSAKASAQCDVAFLRSDVAMRMAIRSSAAKAAALHILYKTPIA